MTSALHSLRFSVTRERALDLDADVWYAGPVDAPVRSGVSAPTLDQLREEAEPAKHFILGVPEETPVEIEFVLSQQILRTA